MDPISLTKNSTNPCPSEYLIPVPILLLNDEVDRGGSSLGDTVVLETPQSQLENNLFPCDDRHLLPNSSPSSSSVSQSLADIFVSETVLADKLVPKTLSKSEYEAFEKEYEERISWHSKNKFSLVKNYKTAGSNSSLEYSYDVLSFVHLVKPDSEESDDDTQ